MEALLRTKVCDFNVRLSDSPLFPLIEKYQRELKALGLENFFPTYYPGDEWFCADGLISISIPFTLCDKKLMRIEKKVVGTTEGSTPVKFLKLLRHETGHAFDHAYKLSSLKRWQHIFGSPKRKYQTGDYFYLPYSKGFPRNLSDSYAQSHPCEDFAECFATVTDKSHNWRQRYRNAPKTLQKLEYVDQLIVKYGPQKPRRFSTDTPYSQKDVNLTLRTYFKQRIKDLGDHSPTYLDQILGEIYPNRTFSRYNLAQLLKDESNSIHSYLKGSQHLPIYFSKRTLTKLISHAKQRKIKISKNQFTKQKPQLLTTIVQLNKIQRRETNKQQKD